MAKLRWGKNREEEREKHLGYPALPLAALLSTHRCPLPLSATILNHHHLSLRTKRHVALSISLEGSRSLRKMKRHVFFFLMKRANA